MFQNISREYQEETIENENQIKNVKKSFKETLLGLFTIQKIAFYIIGLMLSGIFIVPE